MLNRAEADHEQVYKHEIVKGDEKAHGPNHNTNNLAGVCFLPRFRVGREVKFFKIVYLLISSLIVRMTVRTR